MKNLEVTFSAYNLFTIYKKMTMDEFFLLSKNESIVCVLYMLLTSTFSTTPF